MKIDLQSDGGKGPGLKKLRLPEKMDLAGGVEVISAECVFVETGKTRDRQGFDIIDGYQIRVNLKVASEICGHKAPDFYATVTHTFDSEELEMLMKHLNK